MSLIEYVPPKYVYAYVYPESRFRRAAGSKKTHASLATPALCQRERGRVLPAMA
jgi:hypothetical protein